MMMAILANLGIVANIVVLSDSEKALKLIMVAILVNLPILLNMAVLANSYQNHQTLKRH